MKRLRTIIYAKINKTSRAIARDGADDTLGAHPTNAMIHLICDVKTPIRTHSTGNWLPELCLNRRPTVASETAIVVARGRSCVAKCIDVQDSY